jgi:hypothetical protein
MPPLSCGAKEGHNLYEKSHHRGLTYAVGEVAKPNVYWIPEPFLLYSIKQLECEAYS